MTASQGRLAALSRFIFAAPRWHRSLAFAVLLSGLAGVAVFDAGATMEAEFRVLLVGHDAWQGLVFIGFPTVLAALGTTPVDRAMGGRLTFNRSALLALACEVIVVTALLSAGLVAFVFGLAHGLVLDVLVVALASIFALRLFVILGISRVSVPRACLSAGIQPGAAAVLAFVYSGTIRLLVVGDAPLEAYVGWLARGESGPPALQAVTVDHFLLLVALSSVYAAAVWAFLVGIDRPWRRSLGVSVLDFVRGFVGHVAEGSRELEQFFEKLGEEAIVPVSVASFRQLPREGAAAAGGGDGDSDGAGEEGADATPGSEKARVVLPMVHPGPMGEVGGGNLPQRIAERAEGLAFAPHATAGHDFNLVSEREVGRILDAADRALDRMEYGREASVPVTGEVGTAHTLAQRFGNGAFAAATFAPESADDVAFGVGQSAAAELRRSGVEDVLLADAHNCHAGLDAAEDGDLGHVTPGSPRSYDLYGAAALAGEALSDAASGPLELGVAHDPTDWEREEGIGPLGLRVAVTRVDGREAAYVLVDGNNMVPGVRERLLDAVTAETGVDHAEVLTSDTHAVNVGQADNRVGDAVDEAALTDAVVETAAAAHADLEPVAVGTATERVTVTVFGNDRTETLASQANAALSLGAALLAAVVLCALAVSLLLFLFA
ncbi:DUF2070 family protein [Haloparvum alkalitolerans]|uniref:DUF2070 family protein n=1 Tax=Haloparvum alkalitolerans TaxID=1042953 RepID=UPI003CEFE766